MEIQPGLKNSPLEKSRMSSLNNESIWTLPEGIDDVLPVEVKKLEVCRGLALTQMKRWGYELVYPPILEYLDSLLRAGDTELNLNTMKMIDQSTGRTVGIPADITPQIARIESFMEGQQVRRLCYAAPILKATNDRYPGSRNPIQLGAELYGHKGAESDVEIIGLLYDILRVLKISNPVIELSDMGLFRTLCSEAGLDKATESKILQCLLKRDQCELQRTLASSNIALSHSSKIEALLNLNGHLDVLTKAKEIFKNSSDSINDGLATLSNVAESLLSLNPKVNIKLDLAELRGYKYHSSTSFTVYVEGLGRPLCWGGRYTYESPKDDSCRPATGFSADLKSLSRLSEVDDYQAGEKVVIAPSIDNQKLKSHVDKLRREGYIVIQQITDKDFYPYAQSVLTQKDDGTWMLKDAK